MILTESIEVLIEWVNENRPDRTSKKPYFLSTRVDDGYEIPDVPLVIEGLKALQQPYTVITMVHGVQIEIDSKHLPA